MINARISRKADVSEDAFFLALRNFFSDAPIFAPGKGVNPANLIVNIVDPLEKNQPFSSGQKGFLRG